MSGPFQRGRARRYPVTYFAARTWDPIQLTWTRAKGSFDELEPARAKALEELEARKRDRADVVRVHAEKPGSTELTTVWMTEKGTDR